MWVMNADKDAMKIWVAAWANSPGDGWMLAADIREGLLRRMRAEGLATQGFRIVDINAGTHPAAETSPS